jgi:hypothetical protein
MTALRPRWLLGATLSAALAGVWLALLLFEALARV